MTVQTEITQLNTGLEKTAGLLESVDAGLKKVERRKVGPKNAQDELRNMVAGLKGMGDSLSDLNRQISQLNLADTLGKQFESFSKSIKNAIVNGFKEAASSAKGGGESLSAELEKSGKKAGESINKGVKAGLTQSNSLVRQQLKDQQAQYEALLAQGGSIKAGALQSVRTAGVSLTPLDRGRLAAIKQAAKLETDVTKAAADFEKALRADLNKFINQTANDQIKAVKSKIAQIGQAETSLFKLAVANEKSTAAQRLSSIKEVGAAAKAMLSSRVADEKAAESAILSSIKEVGAASKRLLAQRKSDNSAQATFERQLRADLNKFINQTADAQIAANTRVSAANLKAWKDDLSGYRQMLKLKVAAANAAAAELAKSSAVKTSGSVGLVATLPPGSSRDFDAYGASAKANAAHVRLFTNDSRDALSAVRGLANGIGQALPIFGSLGPILAGTAVGAVAKKAFDVGSEVEYQIRFMKELGQVTAEQMGIVRAELRALDKESSFSIKELSESLVNLGQSGLNVAESFKITRAASALATAGKVDLKVATDLLIQVNSLYGRSADEADKTASMLFQATKSGVINVENLGNSFKYASESNTRFGQSLSESLVLLNALAEAGIKNSSGGTALINFLRDLNVRNGAAEKQMKALEKSINSVRKAGEKEFKFTVFKPDGTQKATLDILDELTEKLKKLTPESYDKFVQRFGSDRGFRTFFAAIRAGTLDLRELQKQIENVNPTAALDAAKGLQDTVKGSISILSSTFIGVLDEVFEQYQDQIKGLVRTIVQAVDSPEFKNGIKSIFGSLVSLAEVIKQVYPVAEILLKVFVGYKAIQITTGIVTGFAASLAALPALLAAVRGGTAGVTTAVLGAIPAFQSKGAVLIANATAARAASGGLTEVGVAAARAGALASTSTGLMRGLSVAVGFLGGPIGAIITAVGLLGAAWYSMRDNANDAIQGINFKSIDDKITQSSRQALLGSRSGDIFADAAIDIEEQKKAITELDKAIGKLKTQPTIVQAMGYDESGSTILEAGRDTRELAAAVTTLANRKAALAVTEKKLAEARKQADNLPKPKKIEPNGVLGTPGGIDLYGDSGKSGKGSKGGRGSKEEVQEQRRRFADLLSAETQAFNTQRQTIEENLREQSRILSASLDAKLINQGEYQARVLQLTISTEQAQLANIAKFEADTVKVVADAQRDVVGLKKGYGEAVSEIAEAEKKAAVIIRESTIQTKNAIATRQELASIATFKSINEDILAVDKITQSVKLYNIELEGNAKALQDSAGLSESARAGYEASAAFISKFASELDTAKTRVEDAQARIVALKEAIAANPDNETFLREATLELGLSESAVQRLIEKYAQLKVAVSEGATAQAARASKNVLIKEFNETNEKIKASLADAIIEGATEGGGGLKKSLTRAFKDFAKQKLRIVIDAVLNPITTGLTSLVLGGNPAAGGAAGIGGGSGAGSITSTLSTLRSAYNLIQGGFAGFGENIANYANSAYNYLTGSNLSSGVASGLSSAGSALGGALVGQLAGNIISGGYSAIGRNPGTAVNLGTAIGAAAGSFIPVIGTAFGAAIGGALGGVVNAAFGRKLKEIGIKGVFDAAGFSGNAYKFEKGGLFRSNKETDLGPLDTGTSNLLNSQFMLIKNSVKDMAAQLGLGSDVINNFTTSIRLNFKDLSEEDIAKKIEEEFKRIGNELATSVLNQSQALKDLAIRGESAFETLQRLAVFLSTVNQAMKALNLSLFDLTVTGVKAAEDLVAMFGTADNFLQAATSYYDNFFSENEKITGAAKNLATEFAALGIAVPQSKEAFRALVEAQDLSTEAGRRLVASLIKLSPAFANTFTSVKDALTAAYDEFLGRAPDAEGLKFWMNSVLTGGQSLEDALRDISNSSEAAAFRLNGLVDATERLKEIAEERKQLEDELFDLTASSVQKLQRQRAALDESNRALFDQVEGIKEFQRVAEEREGLESRLLELNGNTVEIRKRELEALSPTNRVLQEQIYKIEDAREAQERYNEALSAAQSELESAKSAVESAQDRVRSIQEQGTSRYLQALQAVEDAQSRIVDSNGQTAEEAREAAIRIRELGVSISEFVKQNIIGSPETSTSFLAASQNFNTTASSALGGNETALESLTGAASTLLEKAAAKSATKEEFEAIRRSVLQKLNEVAKANQPSVADLVAEDPNLQANRDLAAAQAELAEALRVANAINAPLVETQQDLIAEYTEAVAELAVATTRLSAAQAALDQIVANTGAGGALVEALAKLEVATINARIEAESVINFIVGSTLPDDLKELALSGAKSIQRTIEFIVQSEALTAELKFLAVTESSELVKLIRFVVTAPLDPDSKKLALETISTLDKAVKFIVTAPLSDVDKELALTGVSELRKVVSFTLGAALPEDLQKLLSQQVADLSATVTVALSDDATSTQLRKVLVDGVGAYRALVEVGNSPSLSDAQKRILLDGTGAYVATLSAVLSSELSSEAKAILAQQSQQVAKNVALQAVLQNNLTADARAALLAENANIQRIISASVSAGTLTDDQRRLLAQANENVNKIIQATINDSQLTQAQRDLLRQISGNTSGTLTFAGTVMFDANDPLKSLFKAMVAGTLLINDQLEDMASYALLPILDVLTRYTGLSATALGEGYQTISNSEADTVTRDLRAVFGFQGANQPSGTPLTSTQDSIPKQTLAVLTTIKDLNTSMNQALGTLRDRSNGADGGARVKFNRQFADGRPSGDVYAKGGVFTNSIVRKPTFFNESLMGEAGAEAIMPLTNIGGSLGVRAVMPRMPSAPVMPDFSGVVGMMAEEMYMLRQEVSELKENNSAENQASLMSMKRIQKLADRWDIEGLTVRTEPDQPLAVEVQSP